MHLQALRWDEGDLPYSKEFGDHYFSRQDGRAETIHVFLAGNKLPERWFGAANFTIGELGFGTGLNFLETWRQWREVRERGQRLLFQSLEASLIAPADAGRALSVWPQLDELTTSLVDRWEELEAGVDLDSQTRLELHAGDALDMVPRFRSVDAWYLDGFSPAKNPQMWTADLMQAVFDKTRPEGTFATYTAAGWVRRNLAQAGFHVEKAAGFGSKRHMSLGRKA